MTCCVTGSDADAEVSDHDHLPCGFTSLTRTHSICYQITPRTRTQKRALLPFAKMKFERCIPPVRLHIMNQQAARAFRTQAPADPDPGLPSGRYSCRGQERPGPPMREDHARRCRFHGSLYVLVCQTCHAEPAGGPPSPGSRAPRRHSGSQTCCSSSSEADARVHPLNGEHVRALLLLHRVGLAIGLLSTPRFVLRALNVDSRCGPGPPRAG